MSGKVKSLHGVYKALGRDAFLAAAKMYSDHVQKTVEATLAEMESHWYGAEKAMTEADRMVSDFQKGYLTRESAEELLRQENLSETFANNINAVLQKVSFGQLESSLQSPDKSYAGEVLKEMHGAFVKTYGTDYLDNGNITHSVNFPDLDAGVCQTTSRIACLHLNIPNMLGQITAVMGEEDINIATLYNKSRDRYAYTLMDIENRITDEALERLRGSKGMLRVRIVK